MQTRLQRHLSLKAMYGRTQPLSSTFFRREGPQQGRVVTRNAKRKPGPAKSNLSFSPIVQRGWQQPPVLSDHVVQHHHCNRLAQSSEGGDILGDEIAAGLVGFLFGLLNWLPVWTSKGNHSFSFYLIIVTSICQPQLIGPYHSCLFIPNSCTVEPLQSLHSCFSIIFDFKLNNSIQSLTQ